MKFYVIDENGKHRKIKAIYKRIDGKTVKLKRNTPEYLSAIQEGIKQGGVHLGT